jgi:hypothetical protein
MTGWRAVITTVHEVTDAIFSPSHALITVSVDIPCLLA